MIAGKPIVPVRQHAQRRDRRLRRIADQLWALFFLLPALIGLVLLVLGPIIGSVGFSFSDWDLLGPPIFIGLSNYRELLADATFWVALRNTLVYSAAILPIDLVLALGLALLLNRKLRGMAAFRTVFMLPVICSTVAVALLWGLMLDPYVGLINFVLRLLNLPAQGWLTDVNQALPLIIMIGLWKGLGYDAVLFLAGLQGIPHELYEVATLDGANRWQQFRGVTLPLLSPATFFIITNAVIASFQVFEYTWILTKGGPQNATTTMVFYLYQQGFQKLRMGYASAIAYVLFILLSIVMIVHWRLQQRWVHYT